MGIYILIIKSFLSLLILSSLFFCTPFVSSAEELWLVLWQRYIIVQKTGGQKMICLYDIFRHRLYIFGAFYVLYRIFGTNP